MKRYWKYAWTWAAVCTLAAWLPLAAQVKDDLHLKLERSMFLQESQGPTTNAPFLQFPNLNNPKKFEDNKLKARILESEEIQDYEGLDSLLTRFVGSFTPRNFREDIEWIWKTAQVKDILGDTSTALLYYDLALRNTRPVNEKVRIHYDSLVMRTQTAWVDLKFYYKILEARRKMDPLIPPQGVMLNMGPKVNSPKPDYAPFMHPSDSILIFTSRREEDIIGDDMSPPKNEDLYFTSRDFITGTWSYSEKFSKAVNSEFNEGSNCLSRDGRTLIFARCDAPDGLGSCDLYYTEYVGGDWTPAKSLGPKVNSEGWDSHPSLTPDGNALFFTSDRQGGFGKSDIYVTYRTEDGSWSQAENLGPYINTMDDEVTPFFHQVNQTLFFSSTGHILNMGGHDIFKSRWLDGHWEAPKNVGPLVNTAGNEYYFSIDGKGNRLFYAMSKPGDQSAEYKQNFDLYSFPMPMEARPDAIVTLRGYLMDSVTGNPLTGIVLVIDKETGIEVAPKHINRYGYFEFDLINNKKYELYVQGENFLTVKDELVVAKDTTFKLFVESFQSGKPLVFESLQFDENSYEMGGDIEPKLDYITEFLKKYPMFMLEVRGHTDSDGEARYNLELSQKRAVMIRKYLIKRGGFDEGRILAQGFGESRPLVPNDNDAHKRVNRRVEFELVLNPNYKGPPIMPMEQELDPEEQVDVLDPEFTEEDPKPDEADFQWDWEEPVELDPSWDDDIDEDLLKEMDVPQNDDDEEDLNPDPDEE